MFDLVQDPFKKEYLEGWIKIKCFLEYVRVVKFTAQDQTIENITELEDIFQQVLEGTELSYRKKNLVKEISQL